MSKIIAIDYDLTFLADPELFKTFITISRARNWVVIGCTMRYPNEITPNFRKFMEIVDKVHFTSRKAKKAFLENLNIFPDIWIDDRPDWIFTDSM